MDIISNEEINVQRWDVKPEVRLMILSPNHCTNLCPCIASH